LEAEETQNTVDGDRHQTLSVAGGAEIEGARRRNAASNFAGSTPCQISRGPV
jgi:hypothetical protein